MNRKLLKDLYQKRKIDNDTTEKALRDVEKLELFLEEKNSSFEKTGIDIVGSYIDKLIQNNLNELDTLLALARYFYVIKRNDIYIYFTSLLGGLGVIENIQDRTLKMCGEDIKNRIFNDLKKPPLGTSPDEFPAYTKQLIGKICENLPKERYRKVLAGNNHGISAEYFLEEKEIYKRLGSDIDLYLEDLQKRRVGELQKHCDENTVWYEQRITQPVVDLVKSNQELLSAVRIGNKLYSTKIPYDPDTYLKEANPEKKRYLACHCPFVREDLLRGNSEISSEWCYCSAGYAKFPYDIIFDADLDVELLESVLDGSDRCRFAITLPE